jgi:CRP-like cAMP-binding protein
MPEMRKSTAGGNRPNISTKSSAGRFGSASFSMTARQVTALQLPGEIFGLEFGEEHHCSPEAINESNILIVKRSVMLALARRDGEVARRLWKMTADRSKATTRAKKRTCEIAFSRSSIISYSFNRNSPIENALYHALELLLKQPSWPARRAAQKA